MIPLIPFLMCPVFARRVLIWNANGGVPSGYSDLDDVTAIYNGMGLTVDRDTTWTGTLADYDLIIWPIATSDPSWWGEISGGTWRGRIYITAENDTFFAASVAYLNGKSGVTGISVTGASVDGLFFDGTVETDDLTNGQAVMKYALTSVVSGGTILSKTEASAQDWIARNQVGGIDFVISGDASTISDGTGFVSDMVDFLQNLWNVPV